MAWLVMAPNTRPKQKKPQKERSAHGLRKPLAMVLGRRRRLWPAPVCVLRLPNPVRGVRGHEGGDGAVILPAGACGHQVARPHRPYQPGRRGGVRHWVVYVAAELGEQLPVDLRLGPTLADPDVAGNRVRRRPMPRGRGPDFNRGGLAIVHGKTRAVAVFVPFWGPSGSSERGVQSVLQRVHNVSGEHRDSHVPGLSMGVTFSGIMATECRMLAVQWERSGVG